MSIVKIVEHELKTEASELINAAINPPALNLLVQQVIMLLQALEKLYQLSANQFLDR